MRIVKLKMDLFAIKSWVEQQQHLEAQNSYEVQVKKDILHRVKEHADRMLFDDRGPEGAPQLWSCGSHVIVYM